MVVKLTKHMIKEFCKCDSCGIRIGVQYETKFPENAGVSVLCPSCYRTLMRDGYLYIKDNVDEHTIMLADGSKIKINTATLRKLRRALESQNSVWIP